MRANAPKTHFLFFIFIYCIHLTINAHEDWTTSIYPAEELTSGIDTFSRWGSPITVHVKTSRREFAETTGSIFITFFGKRSKSEKKLLKNGFNAGDLDTIHLGLTREIGVRILYLALEIRKTNSFGCFRNSNV